MNLALIASLIDLLPSIFKFVEDIYGPKTGPAKLGASIDLAQNAAVHMAAAGVIPVGEAHDILGLTNLVQDTFDKTKAIIVANSPAPIALKSDPTIPRVPVTIIPNLDLNKLINRGK